MLISEQRFLAGQIHHHDDSANDSSPRNQMIRGTDLLIGTLGTQHFQSIRTPIVIAADTSKRLPGYRAGRGKLE